jgi:hypothetical protein
MAQGARTRAEKTMPETMLCSMGAPLRLILPEACYSANKRYDAPLTTPIPIPFQAHQHPTKDAGRSTAEGGEIACKKKADPKVRLLLSSHIALYF